MKILELFCGTKSFAKVCKERGHETFTIDNDPQFEPDLCIDIMNLTAEMILEKFGQPDVIWASPPCQKFSIMTVYKNWEKIAEGKYKPKNEQAIHAQEVVKHILKLIEALHPKFFFIENPRAMLRKQEFMQELPRNTITYCQYGLEYQKATDIWTNCESWKPKPICSANSPCHARAPRGSRYGVQGIKEIKKSYGKNRESLHPKDLWATMEYNWDGSAKIKRGIIPPTLCLEIIEACESSQRKEV